MCAATYLNSTDVESMAKQQFANGDIVLSLDPANTNAEDRPAGINALQTKNPLDESFGRNDFRYGWRKEY